MLQKIIGRWSWMRKKGFDSLYFMELKISADELKTQVAKMMQDPECGGIFRVKGFVKDDAGSWWR